jgi:hypothetical protein
MMNSYYNSNVKISFRIFMQEAAAHPGFPILGVEIEAGM